MVDDEQMKIIELFKGISYYYDRVAFLRYGLAEGLSDLEFEYNGVQSVVELEIHDGKRTFQAWNGEEDKCYDDVEEVLSDKFYNGRSIKDIANETDFWFV